MTTLVKVCPNCRRNNDRLADLCAFCAAPIDRVKATPLGEPGAGGGSGTPGVGSGTPGTGGAPASGGAVAGAPTQALPTTAAELVAVEPPGLRFRLAGGDTVGRGAGVDLSPLPRSAYISRRHARFICEGGRWYVEDLGSTGGTFIAGVRLTPGVRHELIDGGAVTLANSSFTFRLLP